MRTTGEPPQWALVWFLLAGLGAGLAIGLPFTGARPIVLLPALTAAMVALTGSAGPPRLVVPLATWAASSTAIVVCLGFLVSGRPWPAGAAMALVAVFTSAAAGAGPLGAVLGMMNTLAYVLSMVIATSISARGSATLLDVVLWATAAAVAGFAVAAGGSVLRHRSMPGAGRDGPAPPAPWRAIWSSLRGMDEHARDGVRRAVPLTGCVVWYVASDSHDALWVLIAALAVLLPTGKSTWEMSLGRVSATLLGVVVVAVLGELLPLGALLALAVLAFLFGQAYKPVVPLLGGAASSFAAVVFVGAPTANLGSTGAHRLVDTLIGVAIALAASYLLWPRDRAEETDGDTDDGTVDDGASPVDGVR
ncbi:FUSC family protein [Nocardioides sp. YIM 152588]|uniref:FUSC family protein n=1 Tax=Nocardioides sp. YIM 152588 TaxID=3158259 RepID=UPI0032E4995C